MNAIDAKKIIESEGYFNVIFEPATFLENRIERKGLQEILEKSAIGLRGWNFPHISTSNRDESVVPYSIKNGIEFFTIWGNIAEIFRFYQSGQFLAKYAVIEDRIGIWGQKNLKPREYLDFLSLIFRFTEIVLFIKNMIDVTDIDGGKIIIELHNTKDRELESLFNSSIFSFNSDYITRMDPVIAEINFTREKIQSDYLELSRELVKQFFDDFNWKNYSDAMIVTHQDNLLKRRI